MTLNGNTNGTKTILILTENEKTALGSVLDKALCGYLEPEEEQILGGLYNRPFPEAVEAIEKQMEHEDEMEV